MRQSKYITIITMACALFFASCSDEYMENMNTDPSKAATIDPNAQLTTAQLQTYGDLSMMEIYRNYHYAFTQQLMGCWNTTNYGGRHTLDNNEMSRGRFRGSGRRGRGLLGRRTGGAGGGADGRSHASRRSGRQADRGPLRSR